LKISQRLWLSYFYLCSKNWRNCYPKNKLTAFFYFFLFTNH